MDVRAIVVFPPCHAGHPSGCIKPAQTPEIGAKASFRFAQIRQNDKTGFVIPVFARTGRCFAAFKPLWWLKHARIFPVTASPFHGNDRLIAIDVATRVLPANRFPLHGKAPMVAVPFR
jgi:hypothetical protein